MAFLLVQSQKKPISTTEQSQRGPDFFLLFLPLDCFFGRSDCRRKLLWGKKEAVESGSTPAVVKA